MSSRAALHKHFICKMMYVSLEHKKKNPQWLVILQVIGAFILLNEK